MGKIIYVFESEYGPVYIEAEKSKADVGDGRLPSSITQDADMLRVNQTFEGAMVNVETMYQSMLGMLKRISPDEMSIEVGVKFNVKTGFFVLSAGSEVEFKVNLKWNPSSSPISSSLITDSEITDERIS